MREDVDMVSFEQLIYDGKCYGMVRNLRWPKRYTPVTRGGGAKKAWKLL